MNLTFGFIGGETQNGKTLWLNGPIKYQPTFSQFLNKIPLCNDRGAYRIRTTILSPTCRERQIFQFTDFRLAPALLLPAMAKTGCGRVSRYETISGRRTSQSLRSAQTFGDVFFRDGAFLDDFPIGLGDVDGGWAGANAGAAIQHQVDARVHRRKEFDASLNGRLA